MWLNHGERISQNIFPVARGGAYLCLGSAADQARPLAAGRAQAAADPARLIISHGGSHDSLAHWRALELSAKPFRHSDRGEPLSSREKFGAGMCLRFPERQSNPYPSK